MPRFQKRKLAQKKTKNPLHRYCSSEPRPSYLWLQAWRSVGRNRWQTVQRISRERLSAQGKGRARERGERGKRGEEDADEGVGRYDRNVGAKQ